jgi:hypothetical protein
MSHGNCCYIYFLALLYPSRYHIEFCLSASLVEYNMFAARFQHVFSRIVRDTKWLPWSRVAIVTGTFVPIGFWEVRNVSQIRDLDLKCRDMKSFIYPMVLGLMVARRSTNFILPLLVSFPIAKLSSEVAVLPAFRFAMWKYPEMRCQLVKSTSEVVQYTSEEEMKSSPLYLDTVGKKPARSAQ